VPVTTIQFQTVENWEGTGTDLANVIDGNDATYGTVTQPGDGLSHSIRLTNPNIPGDFSSLNSLTLRALRLYSLGAGRGEASVARIYYRESDAAAWNIGYDGTVDDTTPQTDTFVIPVTTLADLQILVENYNTPAGGGSPDPPPVSGG